MIDSIALTPETVAQAKELYDGGAPLPQIAAMLGMNKYQFLDFRKAQGWTLRVQFANPYRYAPTALDDDDDLDADDAPPLANLKPEALIARLERVVEREFRRLERSPGRISWRIMETRARVLTSLVRALEAVRRLRREEGVTDAAAPEEPPRDMNELRAELLRRIERIKARRAIARDGAETQS